VSVDEVLGQPISLLVNSVANFTGENAVIFVGIFLVPSESSLHSKRSLTNFTIPVSKFVLHLQLHSFFLEPKF
jgi:hypothetical protein